MQITCECGQSLEFDQSMIGRSAHCPACKRALVLATDDVVVSSPPRSSPPPAPRSTPPPAALASQRRTRFGFLRFSGLFAAIVLFAATGFFGIWGLIELGRMLSYSYYWSDSTSMVYTVLRFASIIAGMFLVTALGLLVLSITRTLATAARDSARTAEMIERML